MMLETVEGTNAMEENISKSQNEENNAKAGTQEVDCTTVVVPSDTDVLCGRGAPINRHPGNIIFRKIVKYNKELYNVCDKEEKYYVAESVVLALEEQNPPSRFLEARDSSNSDGNDQIWSIIPKERAVRKTIQALRERTFSREETQNNVLTPSSSRKKRKNLTTSPELGQEENAMWQKLMSHLMPTSESSSSSQSTDSGVVESDNQSSKIVKKQKRVRFDVALPTKLENFHAVEQNTENPRKKQKMKEEHVVTPPMTKSISSFDAGRMSQGVAKINLTTSRKSKSYSLQKVADNKSDLSSREILVGDLVTEEDNLIDSQETPSIISESSSESDRTSLITSPEPRVSEHFPKEDHWEKNNVDFDDFVGRVTLEEGGKIRSNCTEHKFKPTDKPLQRTPQVTPTRRISTESRTPSSQYMSDYMKNWSGVEPGDDAIVAQDLIINDSEVGEKWFGSCALVEDEESWILDDSPNLLEW